MTQQELLKFIAIAGYDIGFGAKKHFASYDIIEKGPGWLGFISLVGGIYGLFVPFWSITHVSAVFVVFGVISLYLGFYNNDKARYEEVGKQLTQGFHELHAIYRNVKSMPPESDFTAAQQEVQDTRNRLLAQSISKQVFLSDWYAHYKFFWIAQIDWIDESRPFKFWRDKIPLTAYFAVVAVLAIAGLYSYSISSPTGAQTPVACEAKT